MLNLHEAPFEQHHNVYIFQLLKWAMTSCILVKHQAPVIQKVDSAVYYTNLFPADNGFY